MNQNQLATQSQLFNFQGRNFTVILINDEPHWIAKEICEELEIKNHSDAVNKLKDKTQKIKLSYAECKQIGLTELQNLKIGTKGITLLKEAGVYKIAFKSEKTTADDFTDWISEKVLPSIRNAGKYDAVEEKLKLIEDGKERDLTLKLYSLEQIIKNNANDMLTVINYNQTKSELTTYKQQKQLELVSKQVEDQNKIIDNLFTIGDRVQFTNEVNRIARATGKQQSEIYNLTYSKLKSLYGIDLTARTKNRQSQMQDERLEQGKKAYAPATLKSKANNLMIADELDIWQELGNSLNAVKTELIQ